MYVIRLIEKSCLPVCLSTVCIFSGFLDSHLTVNSPVNNQLKIFSVNVVRGGGTFGVVELQWTATANGKYHITILFCSFGHPYLLQVLGRREINVVVHIVEINGHCPRYSVVVMLDIRQNPKQCYHQLRA